MNSISSSYLGEYFLDIQNYKKINQKIELYMLLLFVVIFHLHSIYGVSIF